MANSVPTAGATANPSTAEPWSTVTLIGTEHDGDGTISSRVWRQISGTSVVLNTTGTTSTFMAPPTIAGDTSVFGYTVTDNSGSSSPEAVVTVTTYPTTERAVLGGIEVPLRIMSVSQ